MPFWLASADKAKTRALAPARPMYPKIDYMRPVAVIGAGKTRFGAFPDQDLRALAVEAGEKCLKNGHVSPSQVEAFYLGNFAGPSFVGQNHLAPYVSTALGIYEVPSTRIEAACASSGSAFSTPCLLSALVSMT